MRSIRRDLNRRPDDAIFMEGGMPTVEQRLARVEGRLEEQSQMFAMMRDALTSLERRFDAIDGRFDVVDRRFAAIDSRFDTIEGKLSHNLLWTVGIQITVLFAVLTALVTMLTRLATP
jgi:hypothetical protein